MGNAGELLIAIVAVREGLLPLVKASLTGSIIGNLLLILGMGLLIGGLRFGRIGFNAREAGHHAAMMLIALAALVLPAIFAVFVGAPAVRQAVSVGYAIILLAVYVAYLVFSTRPEGRVALDEAGAPPEDGRPPWSPRVAVAVLLAATVGTGVLAEVLVGTIERVSHSL